MCAACVFVYMYAASTYISPGGKPDPEQTRKPRPANQTQTDCAVQQVQAGLEFTTSEVRGWTKAWILIQTL